MNYKHIHIVLKSDIKTRKYKLDFLMQKNQVRIIIETKKNNL